MDAFFAVAEAVEPLNSVAQRAALSGLTRNHFASDLFWTFAGTTTFQTRITKDRRMTRYLPSWSWVGWNSEVRVPFWTESHEESDREENFDASGCEIIDESNITCNLAGTPWIGKIMRAKALTTLRVVLHLWTRLIHCRFDADLIHSISMPADIRRHIHLLRPKQPKTKSSSLEDMSAMSIRFGFGVLRQQAQHFLVPTDAKGTHFFIIETVGSFYERVGDLGFALNGSTHSDLRRLDVNSEIRSNPMSKIVTSVAEIVARRIGTRTSWGQR